MSNSVKNPDELRSGDPEAIEQWMELLRAMSLGQKIAVALKATEYQYLAWGSEIRRTYPDADDFEIRMRVAARHVPRDLMIRVYGWDPDLHGCSMELTSLSPDFPFGATRIDSRFVETFADHAGVRSLLEQVRASNSTH